MTAVPQPIDHADATGADTILDIWPNYAILAEQAGFELKDSPLEFFSHTGTGAYPGGTRKRYSWRVADRLEPDPELVAMYSEPRMPR